MNKYVSWALIASGCVLLVAAYALLVVLVIP
jgi:hypothetical protein